MSNLPLTIEDLKKESYLTLLTAGYPLSMRARGGSMSPILRHGDLLTIKYKEPLKLKRGDIVAYKKQGKSNIIVHRLVKKSRENGKVCFFTKGDSSLNERFDEPFYTEDILGKVINRNRNGKIKNIDSFFHAILGSMVAFVSVHFPLASVFLKRMVKFFLRIGRKLGKYRVFYCPVE